MARPPLRPVPSPTPIDADVVVDGEVVDHEPWPGTDLFPADKYPSFPKENYPTEARIERQDSGEWVSCPIGFEPREVTEEFLSATWGGGKYKVTLWPEHKRRRSAERTIKLGGTRRRRFPGDVVDRYHDRERDDDDDDDDAAAKGDAAAAHAAPAPTPAPPTTPAEMLPGEVLPFVALAVDRLAPVAFRFWEHLEAKQRAAQQEQREFLTHLATRLESSARGDREVTVALLESGQRQNAALTTAALNLAQAAMVASPGSHLGRVADRALDAATTRAETSRESGLDLFLRGAAWMEAHGGELLEEAGAAESIAGVPVKELLQTGMKGVNSVSEFLKAKADHMRGGGHAAAASAASSSAPLAPPPPPPGVPGAT
jgi:hypothetical protein